ncbi:MAG: LysR family transcriptional regulator [Bdellovibrionales bacterium]|nr:LysR family transcriptional regulator [Bdellovibrionales bacterium]
MFLSRDWTYFLASAEHRSYVNAAKHLNISQGAISQAIYRLEEDGQFKLFERGAGKQQLELTATGQILYNELKKIESNLNQDILPKAVGLEKPLRICCAAQVSKHLLKTITKWPKKNYHTYIIPRLNHILTGLHAGHFDLTILSAPKMKASNKNFCKDPFYYIGNKKVYSSYKNLSLEELEEKVNLTDRKPFENKWSNLLSPDKSGFFLDDHYTGRELILGGYAFSPYSLFYFSKSELQELTICPHYFYPQKNNEPWYIQVIYDKSKLDNNRLNLVNQIITNFEKNLMTQYNEIQKFV